FTRSCGASKPDTPSWGSRLRRCSRRRKSCVRSRLCWLRTTTTTARFSWRLTTRPTAWPPKPDRHLQARWLPNPWPALRAGRNLELDLRGHDRRMNLQSLLVSKDEQAVAVLTPVLAGFGLGVQSCGYPDGICRLGEQKFDTVIVDYDDPHSAALVLQNAYQAASGNHAVTVALLSDKAKVRSVFGAGANFVLYKPVSEQHALATLRAATALVKRERRRSFRVPVQVPVQLRVPSGTQMEGILLDLSEDGLDVLAAQPLYPFAGISAHFSLTAPYMEVEVRGEVAWANPNGESGVRFIDLSENLRTNLRAWVTANARELPPEDPEPVSQCRLTDLSLGGCYVETESPFPERSGIVLCLNAEGMEVQAEGMVRVMHPGFGMGIEFAARTDEQRAQVENFINFLTSRPGTMPQLLITPRALAALNGDNYQPQFAHFLGLRHNQSPAASYGRRFTDRRPPFPRFAACPSPAPIQLLASDHYFLPHC